MSSDLSTHAVLVVFALAAVFVGSVVAISALSPTGPNSLVPPTKVVEQTCPPTTNVTVDGAVYWSCDATLYWNDSLQGPAFFSVQQLATVSFQGILFNITGYNTAECPVVNVTGQEPSGATYSFLIYPTPLNCQFTQPTVLSPDYVFGATWNGGASIQVLVRDG